MSEVIGFLIQLLEMSFMSFYLSATLCKDDIPVPLSLISNIVKMENTIDGAILYICV